ncbi:MAG: ABC transporter ATP-binding protein [Pseudomonadota bacterium]
MAMLLDIIGLEKRFGAVAATDNVSLSVGVGEIHALIGPNGAGKTTLINQVAGVLPPDKGRIVFDGHDITRIATDRRALMGIARTFQVTNIFGGFTALENIALAVQAHRGHSFRFWQDARDISSLIDPAMAILEQLGMAGKARIPVGRLSHGEQRQIGIGMALAATPRILLLDEPTAGMGCRETADMITLLAGLKGRYAMLLVEHDMDVVFSLADRISVLVYGRCIVTGTPDDIQGHPEVREAYLGANWCRVNGNDHPASGQSTHA